MASSVNFAQNTYSGEVLNDLLTYTAQGNDTYKEGLIHIKSGIQFKYTIPTIQLGKVIQDNVPTPNSTHGAGAGTTGGLNQYTLTERYLEPQEFMVYLEFNPRDYEKYYKFAQPEGNLVFRDLDPKVQAKMLRLLMDRKNEYIGESIWCSAKGGSAAAKITAPEGCTTIGGENAGGPMKYFDGAIKRILANTATNATEVEKAGGQVIIAGTTELSTGANVEAALNAMWKKCPKQIRKKAGLVFVCGWDIWDLYDQYLSDKTVKYSDNTKVNEEASNVSQGQKQLLTIARAILADNRIMILDEATSSVDTRTEQHIQDAMANLMKGRTSFVIAHRLSTIRDADVILVMKDGDIIEQGNHKQLLAQNGFYAQLYNSQFEG